MTIDRAARARELAPSDREAPVERYFRKRVRETLGGLVVKLAPLTAGAPDRLVLLPGGRVLLVELKADDGEHRLVQRSFAAKARLRGVRVYLVRGRSGVDAWVRNRVEETWEMDATELGLSLVDDTPGPVAVVDVEDLRKVIRWVMAPRKDEPALARVIAAAACAVPLPRPRREVRPCVGEHGEALDSGMCSRCGLDSNVAPEPEPLCSRCGLDSNVAPEPEPES